jgi:ATP-dependent exoDNAse (exonuclease V) beta subunit
LAFDFGPAFLKGVLEEMIDLAFREADGWVIVDYKTDLGAVDQRNAVVAHYTPQLTQYARFFQDKLGEPVKEAVVFLVRNGCGEMVKEMLICNLGSDF